MRLVATTVIGAIGVLGLVSGLTRPEDRGVALGVGAFMSAVAVMLIVSMTPSPPEWTRDVGEGGPVWVMRLGNQRGIAAVGAVLGLGGLGLLAGAVSAVTGDSHPAVVGLLVALGAFLLSLAFEAIRFTTRRPRLVLSAGGLVLHGAAIDVSLDWADAGVVAPAALGTGRSALSVSAVAGAPSYRTRLRRGIWATGRLPDPPGVHVPYAQIPDEPRLRRILRDFLAADESVRSAVLGRGLPEDSGY